MRDRSAAAWSGWLAAAAVLAITAALVALESSVGAVHRFTATHAFTSSVVAGVLVLLSTVLIVDRVLSVRELRSRSRVIAAQAAIIVSQARRTATAITTSDPSDEARGQALEELRTYAQMLLTSAPVMIEADPSRRFLEAAQRVAAKLLQVSRAAPGRQDKPDKLAIERSVKELRAAAAPLVAVLDQEQRAAVSGDRASAPAT